jgi:predicted nucleic-acid-binding Zn-ribbon protein
MKYQIKHDFTLALCVKCGNDNFSEEEIDREEEYALIHATCNQCAEVFTYWKYTPKERTMNEETNHNTPYVPPEMYPPISPQEHMHALCVAVYYKQMIERIGDIATNEENDDKTCRIKILTELLMIDTFTLRTDKEAENEQPKTKS